MVRTRATTTPTPTPAPARQGASEPATWAVARGRAAATAKSFQEVVDFVIEVEGVKPDDFTTTSTSKRFRKGGEFNVLTLEDRVREVTQSDQFSLHYRL